jgi:hypothetical protein
MIKKAIPPNIFYVIKGFDKNKDQMMTIIVTPIMGQG